MRRKRARPKTVAIIGYGRFGRLAARYLQADFRVLVCDTSRRLRTARGVKRVALEAAARTPFIILAVPIGRLRPLLVEMAPFVPRGALVIDVCSVKEEPIRWMKELLPRHTGILGTHPLFGPDSADRSLEGKTIALCAARVSRSRLRHVERYLKERGLHVARMKAREHDALMAKSLFLTQYLGHALLRLNLPSAEKTTSNYRRLSEIARTTGHDTLELLRDMYRYNRYAWRMPPLFSRTLKSLSLELTRRR